MSKVDDRLRELGIELPSPIAPVANYVPFVISGNLLYISGQISTDPSGGIKGTVGDDVDLETAQKAARICGVNLLTQMKIACEGDLDRVRRVVKLGGFVQAGADFIDIPKVINGCSDLMVEVFGDAGRHARSAVGMGSLPMGMAVEIELVAEVS